MNKKEFFTTSEAAEILGVSRIAVFNRIKKGRIKAAKIGRNFAIPKTELLGDELTDKDKKVLSNGIEKVISEYSETLKRLGKE